jgi:3-oxoacyl-[acyl-carrier-protein] synthase-3
VTELGTEYPSSKYKDIITVNNVKNRDHHINMNGREVFKHAVRRFPEVILEGLEYNNLGLDDVSLVIPHQANLRITQAVQKKLGIPDNKIFSNIHKYGNTTAASVGIALCEALEQKRISKGDIVVLVAFGAGFQWGSVILKW